MTCALIECQFYVENNGNKHKVWLPFYMPCRNIIPRVQSALGGHSTKDFFTYNWNSREIPIPRDWLQGIWPFQMFFICHDIIAVVPRKITAFELWRKSLVKWTPRLSSKSHVNVFQLKEWLKFPISISNVHVLWIWINQTINHIHLKCHWRLKCIWSVNIIVQQYVRTIFRYISESLMDNLIFYVYIRTFIYRDLNKMGGILPTPFKCTLSWKKIIIAITTWIIIVSKIEWAISRHCCM